MHADKVYQVVRDEKIIVIVRGVKTSHILDIAKALYTAGIKLIEVTCNTEGFEEMIAAVSKEMAGNLLIGAGTVLNKDLCEKALAAGAQYIVAPDVNPEVIEFCLKNDTAVLPGAATPTEVLTAVRLGAKMIKIFPASALGPDFILQLRGPVDDIDFVAVGGVRLNNIKDFLEAGCVGIGIGGAVLKKDAVERSDFDSIRSIATQYVKRTAEALAELKRQKM